MKKALILIGLALSLNASAQQVDTVKNAIQVKPVVINSIKKDTVSQTKIERIWVGLHDSTLNSYVILYNRKGINVYEENVIIPFSLLSTWKNIYDVENYIIAFFGLQRR